MSDPAIPSPAEAVKASLAAMSETPITATDAPVESTPTPETSKPAAEVKTEKKPPLKSFAELSDDLPVAEPKVEKPADEKTTGPDGRKEGENTSSFIKRLKAERDALENEVKQAKAAKQTQSSPDEIAALRAEIAERDALIEQTAYEKSRTFKDKFEKPLAKAEEAAKKHVEKFTTEKGVYEEASRLDGKERLEYLEDKLGSTAAAMAYQQIEQVTNAKAERDAALADASERAKALASEQESATHQHVIEAFEKQKESFSKKLSVFRGEHAETLEKQARDLLTGDASPEDTIAAARYAVALPFYLEQLKTTQAENATLKARIAEYEGDAPSIGGRGLDSSAASSGAITPGKLPTVEDVASGRFVTKTIQR